MTTSVVRAKAVRLGPLGTLSSPPALSAQLAAVRNGETSGTGVSLEHVTQGCWWWEDPPAPGHGAGLWGPGSAGPGHTRLSLRRGASSPVRPLVHPNAAFGAPQP